MSAPETTIDPSALPEAARIRELSVGNRFAVPERPPAVSGIDVALVRDGRIALLYTILAAAS